MYTVPIVLGGGAYGNLTPPHSVIDVLAHYPSPRQLATYLEDLDNDPALYAEYFWWKNYYRVGGKEYEERAEPYCR